MKFEEYTNSQKRASHILDKGQNIFLTGKPGTGKTAFISSYCQEKLKQGKKIMLTASTGIAASDYVDGITLHRALRWMPGKTKYDYRNCTERLRATDIIVVDEVSMLTPDILEHMNNCMQYIDNKPQTIMTGDFFQLPPAFRKGQKKIYPFETDAWRALNLNHCALTEIVRQQDAEFVKMLERAMYGDPECIPYFNSATSQHRLQDAITICTNNSLVKKINDEKIAMLSGESVQYDAIEVNGQADFTGVRIERCLSVKNEMRVMSVRNDRNGYFQNGSLGTIIGLGENVIKVQFDNGNTVDVTRCRFELNSATSDGTVQVYQFPIIGAYAITIHKSQGQTFNSININAPQCWAPGQLYVALSRARDISHIHLISPIKARDLKADPRVIRYYNEYESKNIINKEIPLYGTSRGIIYN